MARYYLSLRLAKPYQSLHCTLMPPFECDTAAEEVRRAFDPLFENLTSFTLVGNGEDENAVVDRVHKSRELIELHFRALETIGKLSGGRVLDLNQVGLGYGPRISAMHRTRLGEDMEAEVQSIELFEFAPVPKSFCFVHRWTLVAAFADA